MTIACTLCTPTHSIVPALLYVRGMVYFGSFHLPQSILAKEITFSKVAIQILTMMANVARLHHEEYLVHKCVSMCRDPNDHIGVKVSYARILIHRMSLVIQLTLDRK